MKYLFYTMYSLLCYIYCLKRENCTTMEYVSALWSIILLVIATAFCLDHTCLDTTSQIISHLKVLKNTSKYENKCETFLSRYNPSDTRGQMIFLPHVSGISDRIVGMTTLFVLSLATGRKFYLSNMPELNGFEIAFELPYGDIIRKVTKPAIISKLRENGMKQSPLLFRPPNSVLVNAIGDDSYLLSKSFISQAFNASNSEIYVSTNRGLTIRMFDIRKYRDVLSLYGLSRETAFACAINYMLQPKPVIFAPMLDILSQMAAPNKFGLRISIHIRSTDNVLNNHDLIDLDWYSSYFECAMGLENMILSESNGGRNSKRVTWFLFSDSVSLRQQAKSRYGDKLVTSLNVPVEHSAKEMICPLRNCVSEQGFLTSVAEWWLVGKADYVVASLHSGYGKSSAMREFKQDSLYFTYRGDQNGCFNNRNYASTQVLGSLMAGI